LNSDRVLETTASRSDTCSFHLRLRSIDLRSLIFNAIPPLNAPRQDHNLRRISGNQREGSYTLRPHACPTGCIMNARVIERWRHWSAAQDNECRFSHSAPLIFSAPICRWEYRCEEVKSTQALAGSRSNHFADK
jgi:hypothetical protein